MSFYLSLVLPIFNEANFRLRKSEPLKKLISEYQWNFESEKSEEDGERTQKTANYVYEKSYEFGISTGLRGECKYCSLLNIDLSELGQLKHSLDHYVKKTLKANSEYNKIITQIRIEDTPLL